MTRRRFIGDGTGPRMATAPPNHYIVCWKDPAQPVQATVKLPNGVQLAAPVAVQIPQLSKPLKAEVSGAVAAEVGGGVAVTGDVTAEVSGTVDAQVDGAVDAEITKPIQHERIRLGL